MPGNESGAMRNHATTTTHSWEESDAINKAEFAIQRFPAAVCRRTVLCRCHCGPTVDGLSPDIPFKEGFKAKMATAASRVSHGGMPLSLCLTRGAIFQGLLSDSGVAMAAVLAVRAQDSANQTARLSICRGCNWAYCSSRNGSAASRLEDVPAAIRHA